MKWRAKVPLVTGEVRLGQHEKSKAPSARTRVIAQARRGGITLVIGAGVSIPRGVPSWDSLAKLLWKEAFGNRRSPWKTSDQVHSPRQVPQFLPIIFELAYRKLGQDAFLNALKNCLYASVRYPSDDKDFKRSNESLAILARLIVQEYRRTSRRRINAVITFNADDLIEQAVDAAADLDKPSAQGQVAWVVARGTHSFSGGPRPLGRSPIPIYHIHGFVPSNHTIQYGKYYDHMLVFTDAQYWSTSAAASTFANRITASALSEGRCIFVGLSMTDINLLRWLAIRAVEKDRDLDAVRNTSGARWQEGFLDLGFNRHFWVRPPSDDPTGFVSEFLSLRGIESVEIDSWTGRTLQALFN